MQNLSYWEKDTYFQNLDVVIVGSGIVGLNAALNLKLKSPLLKILVVESGILPSGGSTKNAGFACFGSVSELLNDMANHAEEEVLTIVKKRWDGLKRLRKNLGDKNIDYQSLGGFELFDDQRFYDGCADKIDDLNKQLSPIIGENRVFKNADQKIKQFGFANVQHLIENTAEGQIDTGKMMFHLTKKVIEKGVIILNSMKVEKVNSTGQKACLYTADGFEIEARHILIATDGFAKQLIPDIRVVPGRAQVLITSPIKNLKPKGSFHYDKGYYYFRNINDRLLFGGGRNLDFRTEETTATGLTPVVQDQLELLLKTVILPGVDYTIEQRWSGIMGLGDQKSTIIKNISKNISCAVRLAGMGVAIGSLIGEEAAELTLANL